MPELFLIAYFLIGLCVAVGAAAVTASDWPTGGGGADVVMIGLAAFLAGLAWPLFGVFLMFGAIGQRIAGERRD